MVYVCDNFNGRVQFFQPDGTFLDEIPTSAYAATGASNPYDVAVAPGRVYIADWGQGRVYAIGAPNSAVNGRSVFRCEVPLDADGNELLSLAEPPQVRVVMQSGGTKPNASGPPTDTNYSVIDNLTLSDGAGDILAPVDFEDGGLGPWTLSAQNGSWQATAAVLTVGALEWRVLSRSPWLLRGAAWWFAIPAFGAVLVIVGAIKAIHQPVFPAWPLFAVAMVFGLIAWWMFEDSRAERSLLNAVIAAALMAGATYGVVLPRLTTVFPSQEVARALRNVTCVGPKATAAGFHEPSLVFMTDTSTLLTDGSGAADFLGQGSCRFALVEQRSERAFVQRAEAIGLCYNAPVRIDGPGPRCIPEHQGAPAAGRGRADGESGKRLH